MPFGGNDWLALTQEPTLELEIPIYDPLHQFWDLRPQVSPLRTKITPEEIRTNQGKTLFAVEVPMP